MSKGKYYFSKSLEKGLKILSLFNRETPALTQSNIAKTLDLNMTSTYRYINTLVELGYLEKDVKTKAIRPSLLSLVLCNNLVHATDRHRLIKNIVDRVHKAHNISIEVAITVDDTIMRIYNRQAEETLTYSLPDSSKDCLHNTALGKAYLASLAPEEMEAKVARMTLTVRTGNTITDRKALLTELKKARRQRYTMAVEEYLPGLIAIGAPLYDHVNETCVGAVSFDFSTVQHNAEDVRKKYSGKVIEIAAALSELFPIGHENSLRAGSA
jgi:DNA-binding IclR family transcriptional regulator